jgi:FAD-NAD(P)-binding
MVRPLDADTLVVGSGPHGLAACAYILAERHGTAGELLVIDRQGWMAQWTRQLRDLGVQRLRSSCVHHPDPDPWALLRFAHQQGRQAEMTGQFNVPSSSLFADFCSRLVERLGLEEAVIPLRATGLRSVDGGAAVQLEDRSWLRARRVVLATNPSVPRLPRWSRSLLAAAPAGRVVHSDEVQLDGGSAEGERILVLGGGLTAAQLALGAAARGVLPTLVSRHRLRERDFDVQPGWFTYRLERFHQEARWERRIAELRGERRGSVPPADLAELRTAAVGGRLVLACGGALHHVTWSGASGEAVVGHERLGFDRLWLATGHSFHVGAEPLLEDLCRTHPILVVAGLPALAADCRWPGTAVHVMGGLAGLQVGPLARNIAGARMAAERIAASLGRRACLQYPVPRASAVDQSLPPLGAPSWSPPSTALFPH